MGETNYKEGAVVLVVILVLAGLAYGVLLANAKTTAQAEIKRIGLDELKIFEDGVTYFIQNESGLFYDVTGVYLAVGEELYDCAPDGYHTNQFMNPLCLEIILRHELDRRGL